MNTFNLLEFLDHLHLLSYLQLLPLSDSDSLDLTLLSNNEFFVLTFGKHNGVVMARHILTELLPHLRVETVDAIARWFALSVLKHVVLENPNLSEGRGSWDH